MNIVRSPPVVLSDHRSESMAQDKTAVLSPVSASRSLSPTQTMSTIEPSWSHEENEQEAYKDETHDTFPSDTENTPLIPPLPIWRQSSSPPTAQPRPQQESITHAGDAIQSLNTNPHQPEQEKGHRRCGSKWGRLARHVKTGKVLLQSSIVNKDTSLVDEEEMRECTDRNEKILLYHTEIRDGMEFTIWHCLAAIICYLIVSVVAYSFVLEPRWTVIDSMYFAVVTFTTIGYGDLAPSTAAGQIFTAFFGLAGVACLGIALGVLGSNLIEAEQNALEHAGNMATRKNLSLFSSSDEPDEGNRINGSTNNTTENDEDDTVPDKRGGGVDSGQSGVLSSVPDVCFLTLRVIAILAVFVVLIVYDPAIKHGWEWRTCAAAFYFTIVTSTTVGYGDMAPTTQWGRLAFVLFFPLGVSAVGHLMGHIAQTIIDRRQARFLREQLVKKELTIHDLEVMDEDGDGKVSKAEFLEFMLVAMNKVDRDLMNELTSLFDRLDADGEGTLSKDDLIATAKRKLHSPTKKLGLAAYKDQLRRQAEESELRRLRGPQKASFWGRRGHNLLEGQVDKKELETLRRLDF